MATQNQPTPGSSSGAASEWELATTKLMDWATQISLLAEQPQYQWFEARVAAETAIEAAQLARSASKATGKKAAKLREAAAWKAQSAASKASYASARLSSSYMQAAGSTQALLRWLEGGTIADELSRLSKQYKDISQEKKWWQFWK